MVRRLVDAWTGAIKAVAAGHLRRYRSGSGPLLSGNARISRKTIEVLTNDIVPFDVRKFVCAARLLAIVLVLPVSYSKLVSELLRYLLLHFAVPSRDLVDVRSAHQFVELLLLTVHGSRGGSCPNTSVTSGDGKSDNDERGEDRAGAMLNDRDSLPSGPEW